MFMCDFVVRRRHNWHTFDWINECKWRTTLLDFCGGNLCTLSGNTSTLSSLVFMGDVVLDLCADAYIDTEMEIFGYLILSEMLLDMSDSSTVVDDGECCFVAYFNIYAM